MLQRVFAFLVVLLLMLPTKIFSQQQLRSFVQNEANKRWFFSSPKVFLFDRSKGDQTLDPKTNFVIVKFPEFLSKNLEIIQSDFYTTHFGFFCKKELLFEKNTNVPLRFRFGSIEYVNKLEGKN
jgi:hypothetical protein